METLRTGGVWRTQINFELEVKAEMKTSSKDTIRQLDGSLVELLGSRPEIYNYIRE